MKKFIKEPFSFPEDFWYRKSIWIRVGISRFSIEFLLSHSTKKLRRGTLLCMFGTREGAIITISRRNFFVSQCRNFS